MTSPSFIVVGQQLLGVPLRGQPACELRSEPLRVSALPGASQAQGGVR